MNKSAKEFIGNPDYPAISYGGYRAKSREDQPTIEEIKEDLYIMHAQGFRVFRTYDLHHPFGQKSTFLRLAKRRRNIYFWSPTRIV